MSAKFSGPMQPWPALEEFVQYVELPASGVRLFTYQAGSPGGRTFLLIHGLGDEADSWRYVIQPLARYGRVVALDLPGFGRSDKPDIAYTVPFYLQVLHELSHVLALSDTVLVGSSMGAVISQAAALERPAWLTGLVLVDGSLAANSKPGLNLLLFLIPGLGEWLYTRLRRDPQSAYDTLRPYYADLSGLPEADRAFLFQRVNERVWDDRQRRAYLSALRSLAGYVSRSGKLKEKLKELDLPVLIIWGENDRVIPAAAARPALEAQPAARLVILPGSGHLPQQDQPQALVDLILRDPRLGNPETEKKEVKI